MQIKTFAKLAACGAALVLAFSASAETVVKVGVVGAYNAQWTTINKILQKDGIRVKLVSFTDYATPNRALNDKDIDLNAFQHKAFLANDIKRHGYKIEAIGDTIIAPLAIFPNKARKIKSVKDFKDGDSIAIPSDLTNGGRALKILEAIGLIEVDPAKGYVPSKADVKKYNKRIKIVEAESGILANLLPDHAAALINGGNAFTAKLNPVVDSIYVENIDPKNNPNVGKLVNVIVARSADKDNAVYKKVVAAYNCLETAKTLREAYKGAFIPAWEGAKDYKY